MEVTSLISVIIPVYNTEKYLNQCIDSVLNQTYQFLEIILVDDGSTDNSGSICDKYAQQDSRIKVIHKTNGGQSSARNAALNIAQGKYIYFLDSDDYIAEELLGRLVETAEKNRADVVFFEAQSFIDDQESLLKSNIQNKFEYIRKKKYLNCAGQQQYLKLKKNEEYFVCTPLHFYRKEYLDKNNIRFREGIIHEDNLFSAKVYLCDGVTVHLPCCLYMRRLRPQSTMTKSDDLYKLFKYKCLVAVCREISILMKEFQPCSELVRVMINESLESVIYAYDNLSLTDQRRCKYSYKKLRNYILLRYGKYDYQLARKCAGPILKPIIRGVHFCMTDFRNP